MAHTESHSSHAELAREIPGAPWVFVTGATGYVGRHVVARLHAHGMNVRALARKGGDTSVIAAHAAAIHHGNVTEPATLARACDGCFAVVHLVGVINEAEDTFENIHVEGTRNVVVEAQGAGVKRFVYLSGLGSRPNAVSKYHQTKYAAEQLVANSGMEGYSFPSSVIFGPEDEFVNLFVKFAKNCCDPRYPPWPIMPLIGGGKTFLQPIWVEDVAEILARASEADFSKKLPPGKYEIAGPEPLTVKQIENIAVRAAGTQRIFVTVPMFAANIMAFLMEKFSKKPLLVRDQLIMLTEDGRAKNNKAPEILGHAPKRLWDYAREQFIDKQPG